MARRADEVRKWGEWIKVEAEKEWVNFIRKTGWGCAVAYLWARRSLRGAGLRGGGAADEVALVARRAAALWHLNSS
jgi:hypothetical protein